jgi:alpha-tubulin suppressor-like RCC1 family protein
VEQVAVGYTGVCARLTDGTLRCWSSDRGDVLANGNERCAIPGLVQGLPGRALDVAVGGSVCARTTMGVYCWGANRNGELALGTADTPGLTPVLAPRLSMVPADARVFMQWSQGCAVTPAGALLCWGQAPVGDGTSMARSAPTPVRLFEGSGAAEVVPGGIPSCARRTDGSVWCWGRDMNGALGRGPGASGDTVVPSRVALPRPATRIGLGSSGGCALLDDRTLHCWGALYNDGMTRRQSPTPVRMDGIADVRDFANGGGFVCAVRMDGMAYCWGTIFGLGIGPSTFGGGTPVRVPGFDGALAFSGANGTVCARYANAEVRCLGRNVGDGSPGSPTPVTVTW